MKKSYSQAFILALILVLFSLSFSAGCVSVVEGTVGDNEQNSVPMPTNFISSASDVKDLVTDDDKLVINYYDAYVWTVFFGSDDTVRSMVYVYNFEDEQEAEKMVSVRKAELEKNKTMTITAAYRVGTYVVMELNDTSFDGVSRSILEHNFNGLIVK